MQEIGIVWNAETRRTVRSARVIVLLLLFVMFVGLSLLIVGSIAHAARHNIEEQLAARGASDEAARESMDVARKQLLGFLFSDDPSMIEALAAVPLVVLFVFKLTLFFLPLYIALMGFDQISAEIAQRSMRFLTVRARRSSVLTGKFLSQATILLALLTLVNLGIFGFARVTNSDFALRDAAITFGKFTLAAIVFSLAYVSLTSLCSTFFRSPAVSLIANIIALFGFWLLNTIGERARLYNLYVTKDDSPTALELVRLASPSNYSANLLNPSLRPLAESAGAYLAFTLLFMLLAHLSLRARDV